MKNYTIFGERCSGTNYLENLINLNFDIEITWKYGWKHFFGFQEDLLKESKDTLFICIVRNPVDWMNSLFRDRHHLPLRFIPNISYEEQIDIFLNREFFSVNDQEHNYKKWDKELMTDRNIYTGQRYKNIFELRHTKIKYLLEDLPKKVENTIFIKYEDLINNFENTMKKIKDKGLKVKKDINFPVNTQNYKNTNKNLFVKKTNEISSDKILNHPSFIKFYEKKLGYI